MANVCYGIVEFTPTAKFYIAACSFVHILFIRAQLLLEKLVTYDLHQHATKKLSVKTATTAQSVKY